MKPAEIAGPMNLEAEAALLGAMMIDNRIIDRVLDRCEPQDMAEPLHQRIFGAIVQQQAMGKAANPVTLAHQFRTDPGMIELGGPGYLATLTMNGAALLSSDTLAEQIRDIAKLRRLRTRLADAMAQIDDGKSEPAAVAAALETAAWEADDKAEAVTEMSFADAVYMAAERQKRINAGQTEKGMMCSTICDLNDLTGGLQPGWMTVIAGRPGSGKTSVATSAAVGYAMNGHATLVISLEMGTEELGQRAASDVAHMMGYPVAHPAIREGRLNKEDLDRVLIAGDKLAKLPLYLVDASGMTLGRLTATVRRWKRKLAAKGQKLELVIVDYLQLLGSDRRSENRVQEVSEVSRGIKQLAKREGVCIVALSQLNRGVEQREDKRPMLSDLRECLTASAMLTDADTGALVSIRDVRPGTRVLSMDESTQKVVPALVVEHWNRGNKPTFRVHLASGRTVEGTENHPLFSEHGWTKIGKLNVGDDLAVGLGGALGNELDPDLCRLAGYMAGDGTCKQHREVGFVANITDGLALDDFKAIIGRHFPACEIRTRKRFNANQLTVVSVNKDGHGRPFGNPFREWLRQIGMNGQDSFTKVVPPMVMRSGAAGAAQFVAGYLQTDGTVKSYDKRTWTVCFSSVSRELLVGVQELLRRLDVPSNIGTKPAFDPRFRSAPLWTLKVTSRPQILRRLSAALGTGFRKTDLLRQACEEMETVAVTGPGALALPRSTSSYIAKKSREAGIHWSETWRDQGKRMRRETAAYWADRLNDDHLRVMSSSELIWDAVTKIEPIGDQEVYDICVAGTHTFLANGIVSHNSGQIEQDADTIIFLFREEYYLRMAKPPEDKPDKVAKWEADLERCENRIEFIAAKLRHGQPGTRTGFFFGQNQAVRGSDFYARARV